MGWMSGWRDRASLIGHLVKPWDGATDGEHKGHRMEAVAHTLRGNVLWAVHRWFDPATGLDVPLSPGWRNGQFICCYLLSGEGGDWGYKDICESSGPSYYTCPQKYLDMCDPTTEYAAEWRVKVHEYRARQSRTLLVGHWYEYGYGQIVRIGCADPVSGWVDNGIQEYRLNKKDIGDCLTE